MGDIITPETSQLKHFKIGKIRSIEYLATIESWGRMYIISFFSYLPPFDTTKTMSPRLVTIDYINKRVCGKSHCVEHADGIYRFITSSEYNELLVGVKHVGGKAKRVDYRAITS